jgi:hypothetical protein
MAYALTKCKITKNEISKKIPRESTPLSDPSLVHNCMLESSEQVMISLSSPIQQYNCELVEFTGDFATAKGEVINTAQYDA